MNIIIFTHLDIIMMTNHIMTVVLYKHQQYNMTDMRNIITFIKSIVHKVHLHHVNTKNQWTIEFELDMNDLSYFTSISNLRSFIKNYYDLIELYPECQYVLVSNERGPYETKNRIVESLYECKYIMPNIEPVQFEEWKDDLVLTFTFSMRYHIPSSRWIIPLYNNGPIHYTALPIDYNTVKPREA